MGHDGDEFPAPGRERKIAQHLGFPAVAFEREPDIIELDYCFHFSSQFCAATKPVSIRP